MSELKIKTIKIKVPIWKDRSIGIAETKISETTYIEITYTDKNGDKPYPHIYSISRDDTLGYPRQIRKGVTLILIPIHHLSIEKYKE